jgi:hypothetical protein
MQYRRQSSFVALRKHQRGKEMGIPKKRQRLKRAVTLAGVAVTVTAPHDRRATDLLRNAHVAAVVVDDPYEQGAKVTVLRSLRDDPLAAMHNAQQIDHAQFIAGRHWQRAFELAEIGGVKAIDAAKEAVDGGGIYQPSITDIQIKAFSDLYKAMTSLGMEGDALIRDVLGRHMTIAQAADKRRLYSELERKYVGRRFRECLDTLVLAFGYGNKARLSTTSGNVA